MLNTPVVSSKHIDATLWMAEFYRDTGRLRILVNGSILVEWFPPHSWFAIASVAGRSSWGTRPNSHDLSQFLDDYLLQRVGIGSAVSQ
jgi:hypothetical protein